ncbi:hypothetical protein CR513_04904, partial [Mucuna pruriens]
MENKIEALEQQNQELKGEMSLLRELMAQMFQALTQTNVAITAMANQNVVGPPPKLIRLTVMGEKELMVSTPIPVEYVEGDEESLETSFQALEIVSTTNTETEGGDLSPSIAAIMATKVLVNNGFQPGKGLGKELDGMTKPVALQENPE